MSRPLLMILMLTAVLGTGCTAAGKPASDTLSTGPVSIPRDGADLKLPLDAYLLTPRQSTQVSRAHRTLVTECIRRFGLTNPELSPNPTAPKALNERRYGITDPALAAVAGYRVSSEGQSPEPTKRTGVPVNPAMLSVLAGEGGQQVRGQPVPPGGCFGEARRRLNAGAPEVPDIFVAQRLAWESFTESERDPRVQAVIRAWSACMRARGFHYPSPLKAPADPRFAGPLSTLEINTATADIACKQQTNLVKVWSSTEAELQQPKVTANRPALEKIRQMNDTQLKAALSLGIT